MKPKYLLPHLYKKIGWWITIPAFILGIRFFTPLNVFPFPPLDWIKNLLGDTIEEVTMFMLFIGMLMVSYSQEKDEDEYIGRLRLESLQIAVIINYVLLMIAACIWHWLDFLSVMMYNMFTILVIFIARFHFLLYRQKNRCMKNMIKVERARMNLTQDELARLTGVSRQTINTIESNKYVPSTILALKIAKVFAKPVEEIFLLTDED